MKSQILLPLMVLLGCATQNVAKPHYVDVNPEDPKSFCAKSLAMYSQHPEEGFIETFKGEVKRGEAYEHKFGKNLVFKLVPTATGWTMQVTTAANEKPDFIQVSTPPYSLINPRVISSDELTNAKKATDWNSRGFCFVTTATDYVKARDAADVILRPYASAKTIDDQDSAFQKSLVTLNALTYGGGFFTIIDSAVHAPAAATANAPVATPATPLATTPATALIAAAARDDASPDNPKTASDAAPTMYKPMSDRVLAGEADDDDLIPQGPAGQGTLDETVEPAVRTENPGTIDHISFEVELRTP